MQNIFVTAVFALCGVVNVIPLVGVVSRGRLEALYGITLDATNTDVTLLLRHRAVMLAIVGVLLLGAAQRPELRTWAGALGLVSMMSYVALWWGAGIGNQAIGRVAWVDIVASATLCAALALHLRT